MSKGKIKINLIVAIILTIFVIFLMGIVIYGCFFINKNNINSKPLGPNMKEIKEEEIINLLNITNEEFTRFKENYIGANAIIGQDKNQIEVSSYELSSSKRLELKKQAEDKFKLLENYILNRDEYIYKKLLNTMENSTNDENKLNSIYASVCSGMVKNYIKFDKYSIKIDNENGIKQYIDCKEIMFSVNDEFLVLFIYNKDCFWINIYTGTKYDKKKKTVIEEKIEGYNELLLENWRIITTPIPSKQTEDKPIIYLYPTKSTEISVKLLNSDKIICSYPKYKNQWNVLAKQNGDLKDLDTGRNLYSLYYESEIVEKFNISKEGFIVEGKDIAKFLEEKLEILGLTEREAEEFIIYWLPKLECNKYNYIRFATEEEINNNMPLEINPKPDTIIRILMTFKGLDKPIEVENQKLETPHRTGFTVVEWGGTEIKYPN